MLNVIIRLRSIPILGLISKVILVVIGLYIPDSVHIGKNVTFVHNGVGTVLHPDTKLCDNVKIYQNVTLGRADIYNSYEDSKMKSIIVEDGAIICAGAKVICKSGTLTVGKNSIVGANSVLNKSIGKNEVWAGNPAKFIRYRKGV